MSPQQKRSTQYDWFKGAAPKGSKKTPKENAKIVWKFTRILIYLALFVFSMTGCIQTLIIKIDNSVGRGVEFYSSEGEISPHVTSFQSVVTNETDHIYGLKSVDSNYWLSTKTANSAKDLADIHAEVRTQNAAKNLKLQDSFKGSVESIRLLGEKDNSDNARILRTTAGTPFVLSTKSSRYPNTIKTIATKIVVHRSANNATGATEGDIIKDVVFELPTIAASNETGLSRMNYSNALLARFYETYEHDVFAQIPSTLNAGDDIIGDKPALAKAQAQTAAFNVMMSYVGYNPDAQAVTNSDEAFTYKYTENYLPGLGNAETTWRPLVSWGDAWGEGPFYGMFVYPVAYTVANMIHAMPFMSGWEALLSIFITVFAIRMLTFLLSFKATMQQTKMQELASKKAVIDAKYAAYKGNKQMENRQKQEVSEMYKKEGVSMFGSISSIFLTMPFFLAIWRTIGGLPHIKSAVWLGINFSATSWKLLFAGSFQYLPLMIAAAGFAAFQQILPRLLTKRRDKNRINVHQKAAMKKNNKTQNIMMIMFVVMSVIFSAGLQVYWIAGGLWMTIQSYVTHRLFIRQSKKKKRKKIQV